MITMDVVLYLFMFQQPVVQEHQALASIVSPDLTTTPPSAALPAHNESALVAAAVSRLQAQNINLVAIDFDETIADTHTGGNWEGTAHELVQHVRPQFWMLIPTLWQ